MLILLNPNISLSEKNIYKKKSKDPKIIDKNKEV